MCGHRLFCLFPFPVFTADFFLRRFWRNVTALTETNQDYQCDHLKSKLIWFHVKFPLNTNTPTRIEFCCWATSPWSWHQLEHIFFNLYVAMNVYPNGDEVCEADSPYQQTMHVVTLRFDWGRFTAMNANIFLVVVWNTRYHCGFNDLIVQYLSEAETRNLAVVSWASLNQYEDLISDILFDMSPWPLDDAHTSFYVYTSAWSHWRLKIKYCMHWTRFLPFIPVFTDCTGNQHTLFHICCQTCWMSITKQIIK